MKKIDKKSKPVTAIFDLDGTITRYDTYLRYLIGYLIRHPRRLIPAARLPWVVAQFYFGFVDNTYVKKQFLRAILAGSTREEIDTWNLKFIEELMRTGVRKEAIAHIHYHRTLGHKLILATASLDFYVRPLAEKLGFEYVVCTQSKWTDNDRLVGDLIGPNCYGRAKLELLRRDYEEMLNLEHVIE